MARVSISVLSVNDSDLEHQLSSLEHAGLDSVHIDIMDGKFVPSLGINPSSIDRICKCTAIPLNVHLMVTEPEHMIENIAKSKVNAIIIHFEATSRPHTLLQNIQQHGIKAGLALSPATPASVVTSFMDIIDLALVMTVNPGFGGQNFLTSQLDKIRAIKTITSPYAIDIEVDGGINAHTGALAMQAGADVLVSGSYLMQDLKERINLLQNL